MEISEQVFEKQKSLYKKGGVTLSELKNSEIEFINSKYSYEDALLRLKKMKVVAPFNGTIVELPYKTMGTRIEASTDVLKMMDYRNLLMELNLAVKNIEIVEVGQKVRIMNYTIPDDTLTGVIAQLSPSIDPQSRSFKAVVNISNKELLLRPGMFAKGEIIVASKDSIIVIPKNIILSKQRGKYGICHRQRAGTRTNNHIRIGKSRIRLKWYLVWKQRKKWLPKVSKHYEINQR